MTMDPPCFACAYRRVGPMSGWEYCDAGLPSADFAIASQSCHAERQAREEAEREQREAREAVEREAAEVQARLHGAAARMLSALYAVQADPAHDALDEATQHAVSDAVEAATLPNA